MEMDIMNSGKNQVIEIEHVEKKDEEREKVAQSVKNELAKIPSNYDVTKFDVTEKKVK